MVSHLLPVSVWSIVSWATILLPAELIPLPEEANRSRPNAAEGEFMSNAAIGCLSFGTRSERDRRPTAAEHSFGSSLFKRVTQTLLETICVRVA